MKEWWSSLATRERTLVAAGGVCLVCIILYLAVWEPLANKHNKLAAKVQAERELLTWMQQAGSQIKSQRGTTANARRAGSQRSLLSIVDSSAKQSGLRNSIQRMEPDGGNSVKLWIDDADFDALMLWLDKLQQQFGIGLSRGTIDKSENPGRVDVRMSLQR